MVRKDMDFFANNTILRLCIVVNCLQWVHFTMGTKSTFIRVETKSMFIHVQICSSAPKRFAKFEMANSNILSQKSGKKRLPNSSHG